MEKMNFAEELVREFLVFRGFTSTLEAFERELATDIGKGFQVDKILDLIFSNYIPKFEADKLINLLSFFKNCFSYSDSSLITVLSKWERSILRHYIVNALKCGRKDKVVEFFGGFASDLMPRDESWSPWFAIPSERDTVNRLQNEIKQLSLKLSQVQTSLVDKEALLCLSRSGAEEARVSPSKSHVNSTSTIKEREGFQIRDNTQDVESHVSQSNFNDDANENRSSNSRQALVDESSVESSCHLQNEEDFLEVKAVWQDTFLGHTSPISCSRFSASGNNIASASIDGTVRIWTYDSSAPTSRNATIYCGSEIMSLEWDCKSDRLLLIGTSDGGIKAWNVDAKRVVCDLNSTEPYPSILDLKCSPVEPIFVSAAASRRQDTGYFDNLGLASLTVWNMRVWKAMTVLPLGNDPPAITSLSFNHNGKLLAAAAADGMIHMFDMSAGQQVTGWPAHDSAISSIHFGPDETSIFSLGTDGNANIRVELAQSRENSLVEELQQEFCDLENSYKWKREMALDADGGRLLMTSSSVRAPIYQVRGQMTGMTTLSHSGSVTTVDWHPTRPIFLTGSADHSVRVTSIS
ncbi:hypothetical protein OROGR_022586 [Orobanche gracilis]